MRGTVVVQAIILSVLSACSMAYRPSDEEFIRELQRVADGMVDMKQREAASMELRANILGQYRDLLAEQREARRSTDRLTEVMEMILDRQCAASIVPQTVVPLE